MSDTAEAEIAEIDTAEDTGGKKKGKMGMILALVALLLGGGGGFYASYSGLLKLPFGGGEEQAEKKPKKKNHGEPTVAFVSTGEMVISLSSHSQSRHLMIEAELEVAPEDIPQLELLRPRFLDVFNTYLRAVEEADLQDPGSLPRLRSQLLRRVQIVTGHDLVRDILITRFVMR